MPAYFDATSVAGKRDWTRMTSAAMLGVPVTAIMNPLNGPFAVASEPRNADYATAITTLHRYDGKVIGYLPSGYSGAQVAPGTPACPTTAGKYTVQNLLDCATRYKLAFGELLDGIFIDEMGQPANGSVSLANSIAFYRQLYDGLKAINPRWTIVGNAGFAVDPGFLRNYATGAGATDILVTFEQTASLYVSTGAPYYATSHASTRFANIVHTSTGYSFSTLLNLSKQRNVSYFYVIERSTAPGVNTFGALPLDWESQASAVKISPGN